MRKLSQDGGDNASITSSIENEIKKSGPGILKSTKNSKKRKVQNFSNESDDMVNEPLLHKRKDKSEIEKQSAKMLLSKTKTDFACANDKDNLLADDKISKPSLTDLTEITTAYVGNGVKDLKQDKRQSLSAASIHNHMNTNVVNTSDGIKNTITAKTQILVEVNTSKPSGYSQGPLIFTTAKIHTDGKIKQMEPVQVTPVPILSTVEGGIVKSGTNVKEFDKSKDEVISPVSRVTSVSNVSKTLDKKLNVSLNESDTANVSLKCSQNKDNDNKIKVSTPLCKTTAQISNTSKNPTEESVRSNNALPTEPIKEDKMADFPIKIQASQRVSNLSDMPNSAKKDFTKTDPLHTNSATKSYVDINKNVQSEPKNVAKITSEDKEAEKKLRPQPSSNISSSKDSISSSKEVKTITKKLKDTKSGNSQDGKITTSKAKSPVKEPEKNIVQIINTTKPATVNNAANVDNIPVTTNTKTTASSLTSALSRTSITSNITADNTKLSSTTAGHVGLKPKSNNVATVVSSISKTKNTSSDTKSSPSSSTITIKSIPTTTHVTSPSTVKTISSVQSAKSVVVSSVPRDKKTTKGISAPITKSSLVSKSSTETKKPLAATGTTSKVAVALSANVTATTSAKAATSSLKSEVKNREDTKYSSKNPKTINKN